MKRNLRQGAFFARWLVVMFAILLVALTFALLVAFAGRFHYESVTLAHAAGVEVSQNLPATASNAVLHLSIFDPKNDSLSNYATASATYGNFSLKFTVSSSSSATSIYINNRECRLIAINADGFKIHLTREDNGNRFTNGT